MNHGSPLINRIVYTASLATDARAIDPILDPMRQITAKFSPGQELPQADQAILQRVQQQLETYLVERETSRYFTPESLQLQIEQHERGDNRTTQLEMLIVVIITILGGLATSALPFLSGLQDRMLAGGAMAFSLVHIGAAALFLTALPAFRSQFRKAFMVLCTA